MSSRDLSFAFIGIASAAWLAAVAHNVPDVYLDEFFHVRQAKQYWDGNWHIWDPKITTPPGLYIVSYIWLIAISSIGLGTLFRPINQLRSINAVVGIPAIFTQSYQLLKHIHAGELEAANNDNTTTKGENRKPFRKLSLPGAANIARNIALFPPLFFFSGLYYTDVLSVLAVLICYSCFHARQPVGIVVTGAISLTFRQNNIFWCAFYLAGLEVARSLKRNGRTKGLQSYSEIPDIIEECWRKTGYYDPPVDEAGIEEYALCAVTMGIAGLLSPFHLLPKLLPYILLLVGFAIFILCNGGVVLGDKSNHVASLHLPQMLYLWAYFTFFSAPAMLPSITLRLENVFKSQEPFRTLFSFLPRLWVLGLAFAVGATAVRFNTIVHPFTLADNRHYTFYIFKIMRLYPILKYAAIPVYIICAWAALTALGSPLTHMLAAKPAVRSDTSSSKQRRSTKATSKLAAPSADMNLLAAEGNRTSFVIVWTVSSALGLITAPLVEPRYYILPWIIWRLHLPSVPRTGTGSGRMPSTFAGKIAGLVPWLETAWALLVNAATMYVFVQKGFAWASEPGEVQRFMW